MTKTGDVLVLEDSTLDKPYAKKLGLVGRRSSGKHKRIVMGTNLITLLRTDGNSNIIPSDDHLYDNGNDRLAKMTTFRRCSRPPTPKASCRSE